MEGAIDGNSIDNSRSEKGKELSCSINSFGSLLQGCLNLAKTLDLKSQLMMGSPLALFVGVTHLKMLAPWKKSYDKPTQCIKKQRHNFTTKGLHSQSYGFSSSHVWKWDLDHKEGWLPKNWCFQNVMLSLIIREMRIKITGRYHFTPVRMAAIQKSTSINAGEGVEKREPSYTVGGNANKYSHYGKQCGDSLKNWK